MLRFIFLIRSTLGSLRQLCYNCLTKQNGITINVNVNNFRFCMHVVHHPQNIYHLVILLIVITCL